MKSVVLSVVFLLGLAACSKKEADASQPARIEAGFEADFTLHYQQQAALPVMQQPELTVAATDFEYSYCPKGVNCFVGTFVSPRLTVTDAQGQTQQVQLSAYSSAATSPTWIDTTSVRANGRRYLFTYRKWDLVDGFDETQYAMKKDLKVTLQVSKAAAGN